jgi:hypothetical protein
MMLPLDVLNNERRSTPGMGAGAPHPLEGLRIVRQFEIISRCRAQSY